MSPESLVFLRVRWRRAIVVTSIPWILCRPCSEVTNIFRALQWSRLRGSCGMKFKIAWIVVFISLRLSLGEDCGMAAILVAEDVRRNNARRAYLWTVRILFFFFWNYLKKWLFPNFLMDYLFQQYCFGIIT